jgi:hypothetical protein
MFAGKYDPFDPTVGAEDSLVKRAGTTQTDLIDGKCGSVIFIYARGTTQEGNIGQNPGVALTAALQSAIPSTIIQGVLPYPADVAGYLAGGSSEGAQAMASLTARAASQCPTAKIVLSGYRYILPLPRSIFILTKSVVKEPKSSARRPPPSAPPSTAASPPSSPSGTQRGVIATLALSTAKTWLFAIVETSFATVFHCPLEVIQGKSMRRGFRRRLAISRQECEGAVEHEGLRSELIEWTERR